MERRLTTILASDIVGYSTLMGTDERGTLAALKAHRKEIIDPRAAQYNGRTVKLMGDGALMEFTSVVDAVAFAVEMQNAVRASNANTPKDSRITYRIGINIGDIIVDGDDIYGDGVNIAARLEGLAEPGGICVARNVYDHVRGKLDLTLEDMGPREVKNIAEPVAAYRVAMDDKAAQLVTAVQATAAGRRAPRGLVAAGIALLAALGALAWFQPWENHIPTDNRPVLAVLPFDNMIGEDTDYFSDGITEDIITELSRNPDIRVISRNTIYDYVADGKPVDIRKAGEDLGVRYMLEGSVRKAGDTVRITAQLIDAPTDTHVWAERFDEAGPNVFALQDSVTWKIGAALSGNKGKIKKTESDRAWNKAATSLEEYDYYLRGHSIFYRFTPEDMLKAREIWQDGSRKFPASGLLRIKIGWTHFQFVYQGWSTEPEEDLKRAYELAREGFNDDNLSATGQWHGHWLLAHTNIWYKRNYDLALDEALEALKIVPNDSLALADLADIPIYAGKPDLAIEWATRAIERELQVPSWYYRQLGLAFHQKGDCVQALEEFGKVSWFDLRKITSQVACNTELGRQGDAKIGLAKLREAMPGLTVSDVRKKIPYTDGPFLDGFLANLEKAGLPR